MTKEERPPIVIGGRSSWEDPSGARALPSEGAEGVLAHGADFLPGALGLFVETESGGNEHRNGHCGGKHRDQHERHLLGSKTTKSAIGFLRL
jgi:hypothetical protein